MKQIYLHLFYVAVIGLILFSLCSRIPEPTITRTVVKVDTIRDVVTRYQYDSVYLYQTDTLNLIDTLKMRDTVYILQDWATPKGYINTYKDTNYNLTVIDSIQFNSLQSQSIVIETYNRNTLSYVNESELWLMYQTPITPSLLYRHKSGVAVSAGYDVLNQSPVFGVGVKIR